MADCLHCGTTLTGRRRVCDDCKPTNRRKRSDAPSSPAPTDQSVDEQPVEPAAAETVPPSPPPRGLHLRGRELWTSLGQVEHTATGAIALEACRAVDRLEELDRIIAGKGVLQLMKFRLDHIDWDDDGAERINVTVGFQSVLTEARMTQGTLKELLKDLRTALAAGTAPAAPATAGATPAPTTPPASPVDMLASRRAQREQATT